MTRALWNEDAEQAVLSAMLIDERAAITAMEQVGDAMFYAERHRRIFRAMVTLAETGQRIDPLTLADQLTRSMELEPSGGKDYIGFLVDAVPTSANVAYHARLVADWYGRRALIATLESSARELREAGLGALDTREVARATSQALLPFVIDDDLTEEGFLPVRQTITATMEAIERRANGETGILTGYAHIDQQTGGLFEGELLILGGAEGMGKSAAALNLALRIASRPAEQGGGAAAIVSAEMSRDAVQRFCLAYLARIDGRKLRAGALVDADYPKLAHAAGVFTGLPLWISDQAEPSITDVIARCTHLKAQHPELRVVVVDFLQLVHDREKGLAESIELKRIAYKLKAMAKRLKLLVIAPCQVNTKEIEGKQDERPRAKDLQGSSGMRQAADFIVLLYRPGYYSEMADAREMEWNWVKVREASPFLARMTWDGPTRRIDEWRTA